MAHKHQNALLSAYSTPWAFSNAGHGTSQKSRCTIVTTVATQCDPFFLMDVKTLGQARFYNLDDGRILPFEALTCGVSTYDALSPWVFCSVRCLSSCSMARRWVTSAFLMYIISNLASIASALRYRRYAARAYLKSSSNRRAYSACSTAAHLRVASAFAFRSSAPPSGTRRPT